MPYDKTPINLTHHNLTKKNIKKVAKKTTDAAIDVIIGPLSQIPGVRNNLQSLKNKKNRALGLGVNYKEAYVDADKNKYPTLESFTEAAKAYNNSPTRMSAELAFMPAVTDMIGGRASSIVNAGARSRMSGQPQMGHKGSPTGMHGPLHEVHKGKGGMPMYDK